MEAVGEIGRRIPRWYDLFHWWGQMLILVLVVNRKTALPSAYVIGDQRCRQQFQHLIGLGI